MGRLGSREGNAMTEDLWGPTVSCDHCGVEIRWEQLDTHWCVEFDESISAQIEAWESYVTRLRASRDRKRAAHLKLRVEAQP